MIEIRHLITLQTLSETNSLVDAAQRLHLTQSALSHQVKELESRLNTQLFIRKTKPLRFTTAGQRLLTLAHTVLPAVQATERELVKLVAGDTGRLHMAIECHSCFQWMMPALEQYRDQWPDVELDLISGFNFDALPALAQSNLDLVITSDPVPMEGISYQPLFRYESLLAIAKDHPLAQQTFIVPEDLATATLITYPVERQRLDIFKHFLQPAKIEPTSIRTAELTAMMVQLVASQRGVSALPNWALDEYLDKNYLSARPLGEAGVWCTLYAAVREEQLDSAYMQDFLKIARSTCFSYLKNIKAVN